MGLTHFRFNYSSAYPRLRGFTLVELLIVMVIASIMVGIAAVHAFPNKRDALHKEAQRIALLLQLARDEAIVRNRPVAFEAESDRYRFLVRDVSINQWQPITQDELLRERTFENAPVAMILTPDSATSVNSLRIIFGREPVDKPFQLTMSAESERVVIHADGIGHFEVE